MAEKEIWTISANGALVINGESEDKIQEMSAGHTFGFVKLKPHNVYVTLSFPPDTDTPGFAEEQKSKPKETQLISETAGLFQPSDVARTIVKDAVQGRFYSYIGLDGYLLANVNCGMSPVTSIMEATQQVATVGLFRIINLFYLDYFDRICRRCKKERETDVTEQKKTS